MTKVIVRLTATGWRIFGPKGNELSDKPFFGSTGAAYDWARAYMSYMPNVRIKMEIE